jgi:hypothetical protein
LGRGHSVTTILPWTWAAGLQGDAVADLRDREGRGEECSGYWPAGQDRAGDPELTAVPFVYRGQAATSGGH